VADEELVTRLRQGVSAWNEWRSNNQRRNLHLCGAKLTNARLRYADLTRANLAEADLSGTDLTGAILCGVNLTSANLSGANLTAADLRGANLTRANLTRADLRGAELMGGKLKGARLIRADLSHVKLTSADLSDADLTRADLQGARLISADLSGANLGEANLTGADLTRADLRAHLLGANLTNAHLSSANLIDANLMETMFCNVDLTSVIGLERCYHRGPSSIDHRTLQKSPGLPLPFLRGVGLPDNLIEYLPSIFNQPIQFYSCFISYSAKDDEFARRIHTDLQDKGVRCWFAPHDMPIGGKILDEISQAIRLRDKVVLVLSKYSIKSDWVEDEVTKAYEEERKRDQVVLFPIRLDDAVMDTNEAWAAKLRARNIGDFTRWREHNAYKTSFDRVIRALKASQTGTIPSS
jgi:uncharacterized protein YjbI with pentapeptide repeats